MFGLPWKAWFLASSVMVASLHSPTFADSTALDNAENCVGADTLTCGNYFEAYSDVSYQGVGPKLSVARSFNSRLRDRIGVFGPGWTAGNLDTRFILKDDQTSAVLVRADGHLDYYLQVDDVPTFRPLNPKDAGRVTIYRDKDGSFVLSDIRGPMWIFDSSGWLLSVEDGYGNRLHIKREADGFPTGMVSPAGEIRIERDGQHANRIGRIVAGGYVWSYLYDSAGCLIQSVPPGWDVQTRGPLPLYRYDQNMRLTQIDYGNGSVRSFHYDSNGLLDQMKGPGRLNLGLTFERNKPDQDGYTAVFTDADGVQARYAFSGDGRSQVVEEPGVAPLNVETRFGITVRKQAGDLILRTTVGANGDIEKVTTSGGQVTSIQNDPYLGQPKRVVSPTGSATYHYDQAGGLKRQVGSNGAWNQVDRTSQGVASRVSSSKERIQRYTLDSRGLVSKSIVGQAKDTFSFGYDSFGRLTQSSGDIELKRDPSGSTYAVQKAGRTIARQITNAQSQVIQTSRGGRASTHYSYNTEGAIESVALPSKKPIEFRYSAAGRLTGIAYGDGTNSRYERNQQGQIKWIQTRDGHWIERDYDERGRVANQRYYRDQKDGPLDSALAFSYMPDGQIASAQKTDASGALESDLVRSFDGRGLLIGDYQSGLAVTFTYDDEGRRKTATYPDGSVIGYHYGVPAPDGKVLHADKLGSITSPRFGLITFNYNADNQLSETRYAAINTTLYRTYDRHGQVSTIRVVRNGEALWQYVAQRDETGQLVQEVTPQYARNYEHEDGGWLHKASGSDISETVYAYDDAGNIQNTVSTKNIGPLRYDQTNQLTSIGSTPLERDRAGRRTRRGSSTYQYDIEGRLISYSSGEGTDVSYAYDGLDRLFERRENGATKRYVYDDWNLIATYDGENPDPAEASELYIHGPGFDHPLVMIKAGRLYFYVQDARNNVALILNQNGKMAAQYSYSPYGSHIQENLLASDGKLDQPFRFAGAHWDQGAGLYHMRMRAYDPAVGRFIGPDPIGLMAGGNFYAYVDNAPLGHIDPLGLFLSDVQDAFNQAGDYISEKSKVATAYLKEQALDSSNSPLTRRGASALSKLTKLTTGEATRKDWGEAVGVVGEGVAMAGTVLAVIPTPATQAIGRTAMAVGGVMQVAGDALQGKDVMNLSSAAKVAGAFGVTKVFQGSLYLTAAADSFKVADALDQGDLLSAGLTLIGGTYKQIGREDLRQAWNAGRSEKVISARSTIYTRVTVGEPFGSTLNDVRDLTVLRTSVPAINKMMKDGTELLVQPPTAAEVNALNTQRQGLAGESKRLAENINGLVDTISQGKDRLSVSQAEGARLEGEISSSRRLQEGLNTQIDDASNRLGMTQDKRRFLEDMNDQLGKDIRGAENDRQRFQQDASRLQSEIGDAQVELARASKDYIDAENRRMRNYIDDTAEGLSDQMAQTADGLSDEIRDSEARQTQYLDDQTTQMYNMIGDLDQGIRSSVANQLADQEAAYRSQMQRFGERFSDNIRDLQAGIDAARDELDRQKYSPDPQVLTLDQLKKVKRREAWDDYTEGATGWKCNYTGTVHSKESGGPDDCGDPQQGGTWVTE